MNKSEEPVPTGPTGEATNGVRDEIDLTGASSEEEHPPTPSRKDSRVGENLVGGFSPRRTRSMTSNLERPPARTTLTRRNPTSFLYQTRMQTLVARKKLL